MSYVLPQDGYDSYLAAPIGTSDTSIVVNEAPTKTAGVLTIYETDGRTIREKIYYTGLSGTTLTGCVRGIRFTDSGGVILFTGDSTLALDHPSGARIAMTDNINYTGLALSVINGDMETGGIMKNPASRVISNARHLVDKEYADAAGASTMTQLLVSKNGSDPTLTVNVNTGRFILADKTSANYAGASAQAVTPSQTNYIELIPTGSGTLAINTSGFTTGRIPLAIAVANGSGITSLTDARAFFTMHDGVIDAVRTWATVQSFTADMLQITTDPDSANDPVRKSYFDTNVASSVAAAVAALAYVDKLTIITTPVSQNNSTSELAVITVSVPGGTLGTNKGLRGRVWFSALGVNMTTSTITLRFKYGATTMMTYTLKAQSGFFGNQPFFFDFLLLANGATNAQKASGSVHNPHGVDTGDTATYSQFCLVSSGTASEDSTASKNLVVSMQNSAATNDDGFTMDHAEIEIIQ